MPMPISATCFLFEGFRVEMSGENRDSQVCHPASRSGTRVTDDLSRKLLVRWTKEPIKVETGESGVVVRYLLELKAGESTILDFFIAPVLGDQVPEQVPYEPAIERLRSSYAQWQEQSTEWTAICLV